MARTINNLTARTVATLTTPGRHADGGNLYLSISPTGAKSWTFLYRFGGRRSELGLGPVRDVPLATARERAAEARRKLEAGEDPKLARRVDQDNSFRASAEALIAALKPSWKSPIHAEQWEKTLLRDAVALHAIPVDKISTDDVLGVLSPLWHAKPVTALRLRARIERVLDAAKARGLRSENLANPARWRGHLSALLPKAKRVKHKHDALPRAELPAFLADLRTRKGSVARALEFTILTAVRTSEAIGARRSEFNLAAATWTIPAERMKAGKEHRVPLSPRAIAIVTEQLAAGDSDLVFTIGPKQRPLSRSAMARILERSERKGRDLGTVHGFRSTFRDWAGDCTHFDRDVCEMALAHGVENEVEASYRRGDAFEKRRLLMQAWSDYCAGQQPVNVLPFVRAA